MIDDFRQRLSAAYDAWQSSGGTTRALFPELMDEAIELHSVLEGEFPCFPLSGPFSGRAAVMDYWNAIAENWELVSSKTDAIVAQGDRAIWTGRVCWRNRHTTRELSCAKVDVWTVWNGQAVRLYEMFDSAGFARAATLRDDPGLSAGSG